MGYPFLGRNVISSCLATKTDSVKPERMVLIPKDLAFEVLYLVLQAVRMFQVWWTRVCSAPDLEQMLVIQSLYVSVVLSCLQDHQHPVN